MRCRVQEMKLLLAVAGIAVTGTFAASCAEPGRSASPVAPSAATGSTFTRDVAPGTFATLNGQRANDTVVCHARGNGTYVALSVNANAVDAHLRHGDGTPGAAAPAGNQVFSSTCELVTIADIAGVWVGQSITHDPNGNCGQDINEVRLTLSQSGSDVSGTIYWKILVSYFPPDVGMEQTHPLTGVVSGNTFNFNYGPTGVEGSGSATFTATTMTGTLGESNACPTNTFTATRQ